MLYTKDLVKDLTIEGICCCASQQVRWNGRYKWVSVAEHSIITSLILEEWGLSNDIIECGLWHDISCESLPNSSFGDVISHLKNDMFVLVDDKVMSIRQLESILQEKTTKLLLGKKLDFKKHKKIIKKADHAALTLELEYFDIGKRSNDVSEKIKIVGLDIAVAYKELYNKITTKQNSK